jgi:hypothetical protein
MARRKKNKRTAKNNPNAALFGDKNIYAVKGAGLKKTGTGGSLVKASSEAGKAISKGKKMAQIEAYAKEHGCTITQAMVALMD